MARWEHETAAIDPACVSDVASHGPTSPQNIADGRLTHGCARVAMVQLVDSVGCKEPIRVDANRVSNTHAKGDLSCH